jgi:hypothetical protein
MAGFLYRSLFGAVRDLARGRISIRRAVCMWRAAWSLPLVLLGWMKDYWEPFEWYLRVESGLPATYFVIPFKCCAGDHVEGRNARYRATAYDVGDITPAVEKLQSHGCEVGVHGIDAWHDREKGRAERQRVASVTKSSIAGIRMHWLLSDANTPRVLEDTGFAYDSTCGYNDTIGYRAGTTQVFRPLGARTLLELPMHIQDGALFYRQKMDLSEPEADHLCDAIIAHARRSGGVVTTLWHDRSHGPERFWGSFYERLVERLRQAGAWFGSATAVVQWFRERRRVRFICSSDGTSGIRYEGKPVVPSLCVRIYRAGTGRDVHQSISSETLWDGSTPLDFRLVEGDYRVSGASLKQPSL